MRMMEVIGTVVWLHHATVIMMRMALLMMLVLKSHHVQLPVGLSFLNQQSTVFFDVCTQ